MLEITNVSKTYSNGVQALQQVDLTVGRGLFGLLGPNGSGKSTLMRTLATLQAPDTGSITFDGRDIFADPRQHRRFLGYLPQDFGVYPGVSAYRLLDYLALLKGLEPAGARRQQIEALLHKTNLFQHRSKAVSSFSGGMRRRFGIAQALLGSPKLLIVDEPTAGLDPEERQRFHDFLVEIGEEVVVLLSTHIVEDVSQLCPRMAVLEGGKVRTEGEPATLIAELEGRIWQKTVRRGELATYLAKLQVLSTRLRAGQTEVRVLSDVAPDSEFRPKTPDLEDVYFTVLRGAELAEVQPC